MTLTNLFRLHAVLAAIYAVSLLIAPKEVVGLLSGQSLSSVGVDITRLFAAALVLVTLVVWTASRVNDTITRRRLALSLFVYTTLGAIIALVGQLAGTWGALGWRSIVSYLIFVIDYGYFLFVNPNP
jgi:hypothetical protein